MHNISGRCPDCGGLGVRATPMPDACSLVFFSVPFSCLVVFFFLSRAGPVVEIRNLRGQQAGHVACPPVTWPAQVFLSSLQILDGQKSPIANRYVQRTQSTLAGYSAVPCGTNGNRMNANRAIRITTQQTQGLRGLVSVFWVEIWLPTNASDSNRSDNSR